MQALISLTPKDPSSDPIECSAPSEKLPFFKFEPINLEGLFNETIEVKNRDGLNIGRLNFLNFAFQLLRELDSLKIEVISFKISGTYAYNLAYSSSSKILQSLFKKPFTPLEVNDLDACIEVSKKGVQLAENVFTNSLLTLKVGTDAWALRGSGLERKMYVKDAAFFIAVGDRGKNRFDFCFDYNLARKYFFSRDAITIDILPVLRRLGPASVHVADFHPLQPYLDRENKVIRMVRPHEINYHGFLILTYLETKGFTVLDPNHEAVLKKTFVDSVLESKYEEEYAKVLYNHPLENSPLYYFSLNEKLGRNPLNPANNAAFRAYLVHANPSNKRLAYSNRLKWVIDNEPEQSLTLFKEAQFFLTPEEQSNYFLSIYLNPLSQPLSVLCEQAIKYPAIVKKEFTRTFQILDQLLKNITAHQPLKLFQIFFDKELFSEEMELWGRNLLSAYFREKDIHKIIETWKILKKLPLNASKIFASIEKDLIPLFEGYKPAEQFTTFLNHEENTSLKTVVINQLVNENKIALAEQWLNDLTSRPDELNRLRNKILGSVSKNIPELQKFLKHFNVLDEEGEKILFSLFKQQLLNPSPAWPLIYSLLIHFLNPERRQEALNLLYTRIHELPFRSSVLLDLIPIYLEEIPEKGMVLFFKEFNPRNALPQTCQQALLNAADPIFNNHSMATKTQYLKNLNIMKLSCPPVKISFSEIDKESLSLFLNEAFKAKILTCKQAFLLLFEELIKDESLIEWVKPLIIKEDLSFIQEKWDSLSLNLREKIYPCFQPDFSLVSSLVNDLKDVHKIIALLHPFTIEQKRPFFYRIYREFEEPNYYPLLPHFLPHEILFLKKILSSSEAKTLALPTLINRFLREANEPDFLHFFLQILIELNSSHLFLVLSQWSQFSPVPIKVATQFIDAFLCLEQEFTPDKMFKILAIAKSFNYYPERLILNLIRSNDFKLYLESVKLLKENGNYLKMQLSYEFIKNFSTFVFVADEDLEASFIDLIKRIIEHKGLLSSLHIIDALANATHPVLLNAASLEVLRVLDNYNPEVLQILPKKEQIIEIITQFILSESPRELSTPSKNTDLAGIFLKHRYISHFLSPSQIKYVEGHFILKELVEAKKASVGDKTRVLVRIALNFGNYPIDQEKYYISLVNHMLDLLVGLIQSSAFKEFNHAFLDLFTLIKTKKSLTPSELKKHRQNDSETPPFVILAERVNNQIHFYEPLTKTVSALCSLLLNVNSKDEKVLMFILTFTEEYLKFFIKFSCFPVNENLALLNAYVFFLPPRDNFTYHQHLRNINLILKLSYSHHLFKDHPMLFNLMAVASNADLITVPKENIHTLKVQLFTTLVNNWLETKTSYAAVRSINLLSVWMPEFIKASDTYPFLNILQPFFRALPYNENPFIEIENICLIPIFQGIIKIVLTSLNESADPNKGSEICIIAANYIQTLFSILNIFPEESKKADLALLLYKFLDFTITSRAFRASPIFFYSTFENAIPHLKTLLKPDILLGQIDPVTKLLLTIWLTPEDPEYLVKRAQNLFQWIEFLKSQPEPYLVEHANILMLKYPIIQNLLSKIPEMDSIWNR